MDKIFLHGIRVVALIGLLPHERTAPQPLDIDLTLECDLRSCGHSDEISDTANYGTLLERVVELVRTSQDRLLERLAHRIAQEVLSIPCVAAVEVKVQKVRPPVALDVQDVSVQIRRAATDFAILARPMSRAIVGIGSNLGDRLSYLRFALRELGAIEASSPIFETAPVGGPPQQRPYLNMVAIVGTELDPFAFLRRCHRIEAAAGRRRQVQWEARTLDIDLLFYDDVCINSPALTVPHPRYAERGFVLAPLFSVAPERCPKDWEQVLSGAAVSAYTPPESESDSA